MKVVMMSLLMLLLAGGNAEAKKYKPAPRTAKNIVLAHRGYWNTPGANICLQERAIRRRS